MSRREHDVNNAPAQTTLNAPDDDIVLPFQTEQSGTLGRLVRLGPSVDKILKRHDYPDAVSHVLGEAIALTAMLGSTLKFEGRLILQTNTDGPLRILVVNYDSPGKLRAYANFDEQRVQTTDQSGSDANSKNILGQGHLAMTIDQGDDMERYQGIVPIEGNTLSEAALHYFQQSEQLPTFIRLAVARQYSQSKKNGSDEWSWRAGGLLVQHVAEEGGGRDVTQQPHADVDPTRTQTEQKEPAEELIGEADADWQRARMLAATVEDHELLDQALSPERLLYRLFHEEGVRVFRPRAVNEYCRCSREQISKFLARFDEEELSELREPDGGVTVKCEFCSRAYRFAPGTFQ